jgi:hypothetical protein
VVELVERVVRAAASMSQAPRQMARSYHHNQCRNLWASTCSHLDSSSHCHMSACQRGNTNKS